jgi:hypothetical protein
VAANTANKNRMTSVSQAVNRRTVIAVTEPSSRAVDDWEHGLSSQAGLSGRSDLAG